VAPGSPSLPRELVVDVTSRYSVTVQVSSGAVSGVVVPRSVRAAEMVTSPWVSAAVEHVT